MKRKGEHRRSQKNAPRQMIRCACGAIWTGWHTVENSVIEFHRQREVDGHRFGCQVGPIEPLTGFTKHTAPALGRFGYPEVHR